MSEARELNDQSQRKGSYEPMQEEIKAACLNEAIETLRRETTSEAWDEVQHYLEQQFVDREHNRRIKNELIDYCTVNEKEYLLNLIKLFRV